MVANLISDNPEFETFISDHCWAVLTSLRKGGHPVSSWVAYARDGGTLVVSTPGRTFKRRSLERDPRITLLISNDAAPFSYVSVEGHASVENTDLVRTTRLVFDNIKDAGYPEPENLEAWLEEQERVIIRIHPERVSGVIR